MLLFAGGATAQSLTPRSLFIDDNGAQLFDTEGAEGGIRAGSFDVRAAAGLSYGLDSNVYALPDTNDVDSVSIGEALLRATNHSTTRDILGLAYVRARRYDQASDQDATEFGAIASYDGWVSPQDRITTGLSAERGIESRTEIETPTSVPVSLYDDIRGSLAYAHVFNRLSLESEIDGRRLQYDEGSQEFRDRTQYRGELRGAYNFRSNLAWVLTGYYSRDEFDDSNITTPSAHTIGGLLGVRFNVRDLFEFELGAGYFERQYDEIFEPLNGVALRGTLSWHPTRLTTISAQALRTDAPTVIAGAVGKVRNEAIFSISHAYSRTLALHAGGRFIADDYDGIDRQDTAWMAEMGLDWAFGRHSVLRFVYDYGMRNHETPDRSFERHMANLSYIWRL